MVRIAALVVAVIAVASTSTAVSAKAPASTPSARAALPAVITPNGSWTTYHHDNARTGYDPAAPAVGTVTPTSGWTQTPLDDEVYAEPLIYNGIVYAATLGDTVYALNQSDGTLVWSKNVGAPQTSGWICGNVGAGILSTPVIDVAANRMYVVAEIAGATPTYHLFGLNLLNSGNIVLDTPIFPPGFDWKIQQQRGALAVRNGFVYVPFGGRAGDCYDGSTPYHGYVVGVPTSGPPTLAIYTTPDVENGIWAPGGTVIDDSNGHVFAVTGNGGCPSAYNYNDAVIRFSNANLSDPTVDFFAPFDWHDNWSCNDQDLGSASPVLISSSLMFTAGKWGGGFLVNPNILGGIDGQLFPTPRPATYAQADVCFGNVSNATFGSFAYAAPFVYVECEGLGLVALKVDTTTPSFSPCNSACAAPNWHVASGTTFGPPIVAGGAVWAASDGGGLSAFNATTGALIYQSAGFGINRFVTPAEAGGQVLVPSHTVILSFTFAPPPPPPPTVTSLAPNNGPVAGGTAVTITGTSFTGATAVKFGSATATFTVTSATQIMASSPAGTGTVDVTVTGPTGTSAPSAAAKFAYTLPPVAYTAQAPTRILDSRLTAQTLGPDSSLNLIVAGGTTGIPMTATGVILNVTVTNTTAPSALTIWPAGVARPVVSNLNWVAGETRPNLVNVPVGINGQVSIYNFAGSTDIVVDEEGFFAQPVGMAGGYNALTPARLLDTRTAIGCSTLGTGSVCDLQILGKGGVPTSGVSAVVLNATATNTATNGFFTMYPSATARPLASNVNWAAGWTIPNRVIVKVGSNGKVTIYDGQGLADAVIDVSGYFTDSTASGKFFTPLTPVRVLDTRVIGGTVGPNSVSTLQVTGLNGVPTGASAVFLNTTVTNTTIASALTAFPGPTRPTASDLNWAAGQTIPNLTPATLSSGGATSFYNFFGSTDLVVDISGWFI